jgi:hypothetical protein
MTLSNSYGSTYFRVEEYKRPKFNVEMKPVEGEIKVNEQVSITGFAQAFAGNRLDGANVKYRIHTFYRLPLVILFILVLAPRIISLKKFRMEI